MISANKMKVVYFLPYNWGAMPHYTAELANAVSKYADVTVIGSKMINDNLFSKDITILKIFDDLDFSMNNLKKLLYFKNILNIMSFRKINIINKIKPDIIHMPTPPIPPLPVFISLYRLDKNYPIIFTKHGIFSNSGFIIKLLEETILNLFERMIKFNRIIVHTKNDKDLLIKIRRFHEENVTIIPHGAYTFFKEYCAKTYTEKNCILFFGNIREYKGLRYLIEAAPLICQEIPDIKIIIAGEGNMYGYNSLINNNKSIFEIYNEFIPNWKVSMLFQRAEIVTLPYSQMSGQSGIINIAYAFGKPVVASDVGGIHEVLENGIHGYLVNPKDPEALARAVINILKSGELKELMIKNVIKKSQELSWDNIAKAHIKIYEKTLQSDIH